MGMEMKRTFSALWRFIVLALDPLDLVDRMQGILTVLFLFGVIAVFGLGGSSWGLYSLAEGEGKFRASQMVPLAPALVGGFTILFLVAGVRLQSKIDKGPQALQIEDPSRPSFKSLVTRTIDELNSHSGISNPAFILTAQLKWTDEMERHSDYDYLPETAKLHIQRLMSNHRMFKEKAEQDKSSGVRPFNTYKESTYLVVAELKEWLSKQ